MCQCTREMVGNLCLQTYLELPNTHVESSPCVTIHVYVNACVVFRQENTKLMSLFYLNFPGVNTGGGGGGVSGDETKMSSVKD